jgi:Uma2 family endonuclease
MATATEASPRLMTAEEFLALPDDGMDRMLIRGRLWERAMTRRNRWHSRVEAQIVYLLKRWRETLPRPRGQVYSGEAGFRLRRDPDTIVGIDVAYVSAEIAGRDPDDTMLIDGPPILAVEILSPNDNQEEIAAKVDSYLEAGVPLVWVVDPHFQTVTLYRPDGQPEMFSGNDELTGDPHMPGFRVAVSQIFEG